MQVDASHSIAFNGLSLEAAGDLAEKFENALVIEPLAIAINEIDEATSIWQVLAYASSQQHAEELGAAVNLTGEVVELPKIDWVRQSLQGLAPVTAGRFFIYGSHDRNRRRIGGTSLEVDAGTAFGTGHHGTTSGCLEAYDQLAKAKAFRHILDLGCGTGVLAIAAARTSASVVLATDIDAEAVRVTLLNARNNGALHKLRAVTAPGLHHRVVREAAPFDLVFANILARPLAQLATGISRSLAPGGYLILSGITSDQQRWIRACYVNAGLAAVRAIIRKNWVTLVLRKGTSA
jgi:ribosomal protein L11 methyltransferase